MPITTHSGCPSSAVLGDVTRWRESAPDDVAELKSAEYVFTNFSTKEKFTATGSAEDSTNWLFSFSGTDTTGISPGVYEAARVLEYDFGRETATGVYRLELRPDPTAEREKTHVERTVELLQAYIEGKAINGMDSHTIGGTPITLMSITEANDVLNDYRNRLAQERAKEKIAAGKSAGNRILIQF